MFADLPPTGPLITLGDGETELVVAPECGARIVAFRVSGRDVLRAASAEAVATAFTYGFAAFPLMPYSGPIFGGGFHLGDVFYPLKRNVPAEPFVTHGEGWIRPWRTARRSDTAIDLRFDYAPEPEAFPLAWRGDITYRVERQAFVAELRLTNRDHRPMPAGIGFHPYFPKAPGTVLAFDHTGVWPPDTPEAVGMAAGAIPPGLDFRGGQDVGVIILDRCFEGWDGIATLMQPDGFRTTIEADATFGKLQVYDAWDYPYVCIEPVSNTNDGFNRAALGVPGHAVVVLEPGRSLAGRIRISCRD